ncbi:hypothetical protein DD238_005830 [Peronospora effusa]|uniref:Reverse transcriptase Ty1/copia-type domain-containing protein n=1 Tax=Peronospora effusa TaxID=542832 RepID=A0A3M6VD64_9STRA|nr:hypothetical protein DD238_005830 [Peronospora effusa]RQM14736.1 hypothetical protein DD237_002203 [Peronospora effusa]
MDTIFEESSEHFAVKSLEAARFIMSMEFEKNGAYAIRNPICPSQDLTPDESHPVVKDITSYRKLVGSLLYIANATRPNISYAMSVLGPVTTDALACGFTRFT